MLDIYLLLLLLEGTREEAQHIYGGDAPQQGREVVPRSRLHYIHIDWWNTRHFSYTQRRSLRCKSFLCPLFFPRQF